MIERVSRVHVIAALVIVGSIFAIVKYSSLFGRVTPSDSSPTKPENLNKGGVSKTTEADRSEGILPGLQSKSTYKEICEMLKKKDSAFFQNKSQERAKEVFKNVMQVIGSEVFYVTASDLDRTVNTDFSWELPCDVFSWESTNGVQQDILEASRDGNNVHLFSVASQYNCAEATSAYTPEIGKAMVKSATDETQGPLAQRTNPKIFELALAFLTHLGFNMMDKVLPLSVGKTYIDGGSPNEAKDSRTTILHGYLQPAGYWPKDSKDTINAATKDLIAVVEHMKENVRSFETVCYSSVPESGGSNSVYLILAAAPNINLDLYSFEHVHEFQFWAAAANFTTQFTQLLNLADKNPDKNVVLHATLPGLGAFNNNPKVVAKAFKHVAKCFYEKLTVDQRNRIHVMFKVFTRNLISKRIELESHQFLKDIGYKMEKIPTYLRFGVDELPVWAIDDYEKIGDEISLKSSKK